MPIGKTAAQVVENFERAKNLFGRLYRKKTIGKATLAEYRRVFVKMWKGDLDPLKPGISRDHFGKRRAALFFVAAFWLEKMCRGYVAALRQQDAKAALRWSRLMLRVCERVEPILELEPPAPPEGSPFELGPSRWQTSDTDAPRRGQNSKRNLLPRLPRDWQDRIWEEAWAGFEFIDALAILIATACRTAELAPGPRAEFWSPGVLLQSVPPGRLLITIAPVKTRGGEYGPPLITIEYEVAAAGAPVRHLHAVCANAGGEFVVAVCNTDKFRKQVEALGRAVFDTLDETISPMAYRHQALADLKKTFGAGVLVADFAGQSTDRTQSRYGREQHGRKRKGIIRIWSAKPPRVGNVARAHRLGDQNRPMKHLLPNSRPNEERS